MVHGSPNKNLFLIPIKEYILFLSLRVAINNATSSSGTANAGMICMT